MGSHRERQAPRPRTCGALPSSTGPSGKPQASAGREAPVRSADPGRLSPSAPPTQWAGVRRRAGRRCAFASGSCACRRPRHADAPRYLSRIRCRSISANTDAPLSGIDNLSRSANLIDVRLGPVQLIDALPDTSHDGVQPVGAPGPKRLHWLPRFALDEDEQVRKIQEPITRI